MKKIIMLIIGSIFGSLTTAQNVFIPDVSFKSLLLNDNNINTNFDNEIQISEALAFSGVIVAQNFFFNYGIVDMTGLQAFTNITGLACGNNQITSLDVSANTALENLTCYDNLITSLDVSANTALVSLTCYNNPLTSLDVSNNIALEDLWCESNQLMSLDVSNNPALLELRCDGNQLTSLDISANSALEFLSCQGNQLTALDVSTNTSLLLLYITNNQLTSLDISANTSLLSLYIANNQLTSLNLSNNYLLSTLNIGFYDSIGCIQVINVDSAYAIWNPGFYNNFSVDCVNNPNNLPIVTIQILPGYNDSICSGDSIKYNINISNATYFQVDNVWFFANGNPNNEPLIDSFNLNSSSVHNISLTGYYYNGSCTGSTSNGGVYITATNSSGTIMQSFIPTVFSSPEVLDLTSTNIPCIFNPGGNPPTYFQCQGGNTYVNYLWSCTTLPLTINWITINNNSNINAFTPVLNPLSSQWYYYTLQNTLGCIRLDSAYINVVSSPNTPTIIQQANYLNASTNANSYQWYLNGNLISGATSQSYYPLVDGFYTVEAIGSNCCSSPISSSFQYVSVGIEPLINNIEIFPNPSSGVFFIKGYEKMNVEIMDYTGKKVYSKLVIQNIEDIDLSFVGKGIYLVRIFKDEYSMYSKIIIK